MVELDSYQLSAISKMKNGCILCGNVGSGKSRTALAYFFKRVCQGSFPMTYDDIFKPMYEPRDLYIITTAKKRDTEEWLEECKPFRLFEDPDNSFCGVSVCVDSWNNIKKYTEVENAFFIFDEQRVVGYGAWTKAFLKITKQNKWILLTATPADVWMDYCPVFIANGFFKNKTDFSDKHVRWARGSKYPKIDGYYNTGILVRYRNSILVTMEDKRQTIRHEIVIPVEYDKDTYKRIWKDRWDIYDDCPVKETGKLFYLLRRVVNSDESRKIALVDILMEHKKIIIFYNFNYELEIIREILTNCGRPFSEWNGNKHEEILNGDRWAYVVQYNAGAEGWNCVATNVMIFYSQSYSYRMTEQAMGRIDRMNTSYKDLYYYKLRSVAPIDVGIKRALANKRNFNENAFLRSNNL